MAATLECGIRMTDLSQIDPDAKVRAALTERGDDGRTPRHTLFFFYGGDLQQLAKAASGAGYLVRPTNRHDGVVIETVTAVDEQNFRKHARQMEAWTEEFGCDCDGWECQLVNQ